MEQLSKMGKVVRQLKAVPIKDFQIGAPYQRSLKPGKLRGIKKSIEEQGYWPHSVLICRDDLTIIDGQHRRTAAQTLGIKKLPCVTMDFDSLEEEAAFYVIVNSFNTMLKPVDMWEGRMLAKDPVAEILYHLAQSNESMLRNRIAIKGRSSKKSKFTIQNVLVIMSLVTTGQYRTYGVAEHDKWIKQSVQYGKEEITTRVNLFVSWFDKWVPKKSESPIAYRRESVRAICALYRLFQAKDYLARQGQHIAKKLSTFSFDSTYYKATLGGKILLLVDHYNQGKKKYRLEYTIT